MARDDGSGLSEGSKRFVIRRIVRRFALDGCPDTAAGLTFYTVLALIPSAIAGFSVLSVLGRDEETSALLLEVARGVLPEGAAGVAEGFLGQLADARISGIVLTLALLLAVWSTARYVGVFGRGMNSIYGVAEGRPWWRLKLTHLMVAVVSMLCIAIVVLLLVGTGPVAEAVGQALGLGDGVLLAWRIVRWPLLLAVLVFVVALLYYFAPNIDHPRFRWLSVGAAFALVVLIVASVLYGLYVTRFAHYDRVYGPLAGVIVFALWLWIANMALLTGAEFDAEAERVRELNAGIPAETQVQVPLRDARRIAKTVRHERADAEAAHRIRRR